MEWTQHLGRVLALSSRMLEQLHERRLAALADRKVALVDALRDVVGGA